jgi:hypothetical protein
VTIDGATLSIKAPATEDDDSGDGIVFYRIYRTSGTAQPVSDKDRYDVVDNTGSTVSWTDRSPGSWHYWVTAVDKHYSESAFSAVVP